MISRGGTHGGHQLQTRPIPYTSTGCGAIGAGVKCGRSNYPDEGESPLFSGSRANALRYAPCAMAVPAMKGHGRDAPAPAGKVPALRATAAPVGASDASLRLRRAEQRSAPLIFNLDSADNRCAEVWAACAPAGRSFPHSEPRSGSDGRTRPAATYGGLDKCAVSRNSRERKFARFSA